MLEDSLGSTGGKVLGSYEVIKMIYTDGKLLGTILINVDGIKLGIYVVTYLVSLYESFGGSNDGNIEGLFL